MNRHCPNCLRQVPISPGGVWGRHRVGPGKRAAICQLSGQPAPQPKKKPTHKVRTYKAKPPAKRKPKQPRAPKVCPEHGLALVAGRTQYGTRWACPAMGCSVILWGGSTSTPANVETRAARMRAHDAFDRLWSPGEPGSRKRAYAALAAFMGLPEAKAHIGMFDAAQCEQVIEFCSILAADPAAFQESQNVENQTG